MGDLTVKNELTKVAEYAKRHGYTVVMARDHIVASNNHGTIRTGSMDTMKKVCAK